MIWVPIAEYKDAPNRAWRREMIGPVQVRFGVGDVKCQAGVSSGRAQVYIVTLT